MEQRHSPLTGINKDTLERLAPAWYYEFDTYRGQEATPLVVDGVLYTTSAWSKAYALNAATGELIWSYDPKVPGAAGAKACCDVNSRGPALYENKLIIATLDGRLIALDRITGAEIWSTVTVDQTKMYTITGAPRVVKDKVVIGNAGAEFGVRGYVSAYDADTGELAWRFYVVPGDPAAAPDGAASDKALAEIAAPTWFGRWYEMGGGGTPWDALVYDAELDQLYVGTGNGSPWNRNVRSDGRGDNLFLASVLALDPDTGEYLWHYQEAPGESWDFTSTQPMILADLTLGGEQRKVIMHAPKNGFFYVLDRRTGKVLSANNFVPTYWATHVDLATGRPAIAPNAYYDQGPFVGSPTGLGAHNWSPMSYSPVTGLVYFRASRASLIYRNDPEFRFREGLNNTGIYRGPPTEEDRALNAANPPLTGSSLIAWDPVAGGPRFEIDGFGGGVLTTAANLLFQGRGTITGELIAFDAATGEQLWSHETPNAMAPGPISYAVGGEQYIAVMAGPRILRRQRRGCARAQSGAHLRLQARRHGHAAAGPRPRAARESTRGNLLAGGRGGGRRAISRVLLALPRRRNAFAEHHSGSAPVRGAHERRAVEEHRHRRRVRGERHDRLVGVLEPRGSRDDSRLRRRASARPARGRSARRAARDSAADARHDGVVTHRTVRTSHTSPF